MYYVYIIKSVIDSNRIYTGYTRDLRKRMDTHNRGGSPHTAKYKPWVLAFYAAFPNKYTAINFETYLKTASGIAFRNKRFI